ncbi:MAG: MFS transporter [Eubacteriales bacterium]|nr:MFS transporter [Eubacteriales bacterium]MDD4186963.1 MFS transporter [Eubacteriales bacterium]
MPALLFGVVIAGLNYGASSSAFPAITADYYGLKHFGANFGLLYMAWGLAGIFGPLMAGWVVDHTGRYDGAYLLAAVMLLIAATISFTLKEKAS